MVVRSRKACTSGKRSRSRSRSRSCQFLSKLARGLAFARSPFQSELRMPPWLLDGLDARMNEPESFAKLMAMSRGAWLLAGAVPTHVADGASSVASPTGLGTRGRRTMLDSVAIEASDELAKTKPAGGGRGGARRLPWVVGSEANESSCASLSTAAGELPGLPGAEAELVCEGELSVGLRSLHSLRITIAGERCRRMASLHPRERGGCTPNLRRDPIFLQAGWMSAGPACIGASSASLKFGCSPLRYHRWRANGGGYKSCGVVAVFGVRLVRAVRCSKSNPTTFCFCLFSILIRNFLLSPTRLTSLNSPAGCAILVRGLTPCISRQHRSFRAQLAKFGE